MKNKNGLWFLIAMIVVLSGCGKETIPVVLVSGTVLYQGRPIEGAAVQFYGDPPATRSCSGVTDSTGTYKIYTAGTNAEGAMPGSYRVAIKKVININAKAPDKDVASYDPAHFNSSPLPSLKNILPDKWGDPDKSGLTAQVVKGKNNFNFEIE